MFTFGGVIDMKNFISFIAVFLLFSAFLFAQDDAPAGVSDPPKYALVIGNGNYQGGLSPLANPVNDARDMGDALLELGFDAETLLDAGLDQMEDAVTRFKDKLGSDKNSYGFFFYAGHGVQSNGENYLVPVDADIPRETYLQQRAVWVQAVLDDLNTAGNSLNIVVLDACRDNPFGWSRSGGTRSRGLLVVNQQPADSIIVYATSAGQTAEDGEGRNGLFTGQLLKNIRMPGLEVNELFRRTGADVSEVSNRKQIPAIYSQFFGTAYLGAPPGGAISITPARPVNPAQTPQQVSGGKAKNAKLWTAGVSAGTAFSAPWFIGTVRGTIAPFNYSFLELGFDLGLASGEKGLSYNSIYPYAHYAFYLPFAQKSGWYIGAGGGYLRFALRSSHDSFVNNSFAAIASTGFNILDMINVSYTLQTNFKDIGNKVSVGYAYRFKGTGGRD